METITVDKRIMGGHPVLKGTRFKIDHLLGELIDGRSIKEISENYDLDLQKIKDCLTELVGMI